ncbi:MAG: hypothetical protein P9L93_07555 [Candidatus Gorgyraea atricola]|nr:hypothetical protein [Candidatus Gorgyraea atricola]
MTDNPAVKATWMSKIKGNRAIKPEMSLIIIKEAAIKISKEGKKFMAFAPTIETGISQCGKVDSLIRFLLSIKLVTDLVIDS